MGGAAMMDVQVPSVETERLLLRGFRESDFEDYAAMLADPEVGRTLGGVQSRTDAWRSLALISGHWALRGFGFWAVERKSDGAVLGRIGLWQPEGWPGLEVGWTLASRYWGQGYATEAGRASLDYGFRTFGVDRLISLIAPDNRRSQAVARRLGETKGEPFQIVLGGQAWPVEIWEIGRAEWAVRQA
jgi:RimJ/RimL family protein N-acetyltransferase